MPKIEDGTKIPVDSGTTTATTVGKLVDSTKSFLSTVKVGDLIRNVTDETFSFVTAVDSDTTLSVSADVFTTGEVYIINNDVPSKTFKIDGRPLQKGGYEMVFVDADKVGINRMNARSISSSVVVSHLIFSAWTDANDAAFGSRQAFVDAVELFMYA